MTARRTATLVALLGAAAGPAAAEPAHVHGVARLDVALDGNSINIQLDSPLVNLLGFERAPRDDAERRQSAAAVARLKDAAALFMIDPAARCTPGQVGLTSAALGLGAPAAAHADSHADIEASFAFDCRDAARASHIDVGLFAFARLQRIQVQLATPGGQFKRELKRPDKRILLTK